MNGVVRRRSPRVQQRYVVLAYAVVSGIWIYGEKRGDVIVGRDVGGAVVLALAVGVGAIVGRWWVLLALIGPLLALGYLQAIGYVSASDDGADPLFSAPGVSVILWLGALILVGVGIGSVCRWWSHRRGWE